MVKILLHFCSLFFSFLFWSVTYWKHPLSGLSSILIILLMMIFGNVVVYFLHRYPLHRRWSFFSYAFEEHTVKHHAKYSYPNVDIKNFSEISQIIFPQGVIFIFVFVFCPSLYYVFSFIDPSLASLLLACMSGYFLLYEFMHSVSHLPRTNLLFKFAPILLFMRQHHRLHHDPRLMSRYNFCIVYPLMDYVMGTVKKEHENKKLV